MKYSIYTSLLPTSGVQRAKLEGQTAASPSSNNNKKKTKQTKKKNPTRGSNSAAALSGRAGPKNTKVGQPVTQTPGCALSSERHQGRCQCGPMLAAARQRSQQGAPLLVFTQSDGQRLIDAGAFWRRRKKYEYHYSG